jgi:hypothetical protein
MWLSSRPVVPSDPRWPPADALVLNGNRAAEIQRGQKLCSVDFVRWLQGERNSHDDSHQKNDRS